MNLNDILSRAFRAAGYQWDDHSNRPGPHRLAAVANDRDELPLEELEQRAWCPIEQIDQ